MQDTNHLIDGRLLYKRLFVRAVLAAAGLAGLFFVVPGVLRLLLPFVIAYLVAAVLNPVVNRINQQLGISRRIIALVLDLLAFFVIISLAGLLIYSVANEAIAFAVGIQQNWDDLASVFDGLEGRLAWLFEMLPPQVMEVLGSFEESLTGFIQNAGKNLLSSAISAMSSMTTKTGNFFVKYIMAVLAAYFMIADYDLVSAWIGKFTEGRLKRYVSLLQTSVVTALGGYFKSQLLLALTAFIVMFAALLIYGQPYALLIALFLGFIDLLPIVGTSAVLIPWGVIEWIGGDMNKGLYLIAISIIFFLVRKVIEPKIVGSQTGLHPLAALISTYVGLQFSGVWGAVLGPVVLMLVLSILKSGVFDSTIADLKAVADRITRILKSQKS